MVVVKTVVPASLKETNPTPMLNLSVVLVAVYTVPPELSSQREACGEDHGQIVGPTGVCEGLPGLSS